MFYTEGANCHDLDRFESKDGEIHGHFNEIQIIQGAFTI